MIAFQVNDMTCQHCVGTITKAIAAVDTGARVHVDLALHRVEVDSARSEAPVLAQAIEAAGYSPVRVDAAGAAATRPAGRRCCGG